MNRAFLTLTVLCVCLSARVASADYVDPPGWDGDSYFTHRSWSFDTSDSLPVMPDDGSVGPGSPRGSVTGGDWVDDLGVDDLGKNRQGGWQLNSGDAIMELALPNTEKDGMRKELWLQATYKRSNGSAPEVSVFAMYLPPSGVKYDFTLDDALYEPLVPGGDWYRATLRFSIFPQPPQENVNLTYGGSDPNGYVIIDQVDIDTRGVIPEPATVVMLLGLGVIGLVGCLRRRRWAV